MLRLNGYIVCCSLAVLVFACVASSNHGQEIEVTRAEIHRVESMPLAQEVAARELADAQSALDTAESLSRKHGSGGEIANAIDLAKRRIDIAEQEVVLERAKRAIDAAEQERESLLITTREQARDPNTIAYNVTRDEFKSND